MDDLHFHKLYPDEYERAHAAAVGAIVGHMYGSGVVPPKLTEQLHAAYRLATAAAFDAGFALARSTDAFGAVPSVSQEDTDGL